MTLIHAMPSKLSFFYDVIFKSHGGSVFLTILFIAKHEGNVKQKLRELMFHLIKGKI